MNDSVRSEERAFQKRSLIGRTRRLDAGIFGLDDGRGFQQSDNLPVDFAHAPQLVFRPAVGLVAQLVEQCPFKALVQGSSPCQPTTSNAQFDLTNADRSALRARHVQL